MMVGAKLILKSSHKFEEGKDHAHLSKLNVGRWGKQEVSCLLTDLL